MRTLFIILTTLLCGYQGMTQVSRLSVDIPKGVYTVKGDYYFDYHNYSTAIANYRKSVNQNPNDAYAMLQIADAYHKLGNDDLAGSWYDKAFRLNADIEETYILKYMSILNKYEKYDELRRWMTVYTDKVDKIHPSGDANESHKDSTWFLLTNLKSINSAKSDAGAALYNDKLIFSSDRFANNDGKYTLHRSVVNANGQYSAPAPLPETINSGTNEGDVAIAERQNRLFFSRTGPSKGDDKKALPEVFFCDLPAGQSDKVESNKLTIKNFDHGMEHPAVNSDGTVLYFTSNNPKHGHGFDLYRSELTGKKWSLPHPLHTGINTKGDELYPVLYNDSILYFASNRPGGLGGLDIYRVNTRHKNAHVEHLSAPVNSPADDFGLVFNNKGTEGYLTSDRPGGLGGNDLYKVYALPVKTKKSAAGENVSKPEVLSIYTSVGDEIKLAGKSKENLEFDFVPGIAYSLIMEQDNYKTGTINNGSKTDLPKRNTYTFHIQKSGEVVSQQGNRNAKVQDTHINPGDLITFQLIPSKVLDYESDDSRIRLNRAEEKINGKATIVFSYVAEGGPEIPGINDTTTIADLRDASKNNLDEDREADTVSSAGTVLAKNIQPDIKTLNPITGKTEIANQNNTVSTPDAIKAVDAKDNNSPSIVLNDTGKSNLQKSDKAIADTVSSSGTVLAKNTQPDNNVAGTDTPKMETAKQNTTVFIPGDVKSTDKKELTNTVAADSLTHADGIVKKEIIPNGIQEKSSVTATKQSGAASMIKPSPTSDSLERNGVIEKNSLAKSSTRLSSSDVTAKPEEATAQKQPVSKNKVADANTINKNASEVVQPDLKNADRIADSGQLNSSDKNKSLIKNELISDSSPSPTTANSLAPGNRENSDFQYRVQIAASASEVRDVQLKRIYHGTKEIRFFKEDGYYKYYIEETPSYPDARRVLKESGVENAFIAAYKGGTKWKLNEAIAFQKKERMQLAGNENSIVKPQTVNDNVVKRAQQDEQKNTSLVPGTKKTSKQVEDEAVAKYSAVSPQAIATKGNSPDNRGEKSQVNAISQLDDSTAIRKQLSGSLETTMVAGERNSPPSSTDALVSQNKNQTEQNQSENKNRNANPGIAVENTARTIQQKDIALTGDDHQPDGLSDRNNGPLKSTHLRDSSQLQSPATPDYMANDIKENNDFQYRVQIAASRAELRDAQLKKIYSGAREIRSFEEDGYYKYYIGEASRYYVASQILKESNADNAFISVYKGKTKWQLQEAIASQNKVPLIRSELAKTDSLVKIVTVNFDLDEFVLSPNERLHLQEDVIGQLKSNAAYYTIVNGYADIRGSEEYNFGLSQERAFFVEQLIVDGSIPSERVTTQYFGESQVLKYCPENENCDESVHQVNRRVEVLLLMNRKQR